MRSRFFMLFCRFILKKYIKYDILKCVHINVFARLFGINSRILR